MLSNIRESLIKWVEIQRKRLHPAGKVRDDLIEETAFRQGAVAHALISAPWEPGRVDYLRSGVRDQPGQKGKTLSLPKNTKN